MIDVTARILQQPLSEALGQQVIVENRPGGGGLIGTMEVVNARPDGHTLLLANNGANVILPLTQKVPYDPLTAFSPVTLLSTAPTVLLAGAGVPARTLDELLRYGKSQPQGLTLSSSGSLVDMLTDLFSTAAGFPLVKVRYQGQAPAAMAVLSGEVQLSFNVLSGAVMQGINSGKLKAIAVASAEPSPMLAGVPPLARLAPVLAAESWYGIMAPAKTPPEVVAKLNEAFAKALARPEVRDAFQTAFVTPKPSTPAELARLMSSEYAMWKKVIRDNKLTFAP